MLHNLPTKKRTEYYPAGNVVVLKPADPERIKEWKRKQRMEIIEKCRKHQEYMNARKRT